MNPEIDKYLVDGCGRCPLGGTPECKVNNWQDELKQLRSIVLECGLTEELKWKIPCYTYNKSNVLNIAAFKEFCAVSFFKGSLLKDSHQILDKPGENSQASRYLKFYNVTEILNKKDIIKTYIFEAVELEKAGLKVKFKKTPEPLPDELQKILSENIVLKNAFEALTPGRQRGYILFFSQPKQSKTRISRIEKCIPQIINGKGLNDR